MRRLLFTIALLAVVAAAPLWEAKVPRSVRISVWGVLLVVCVAALAAGVAQKRREGRSWNEALALGSKLMTGSVWLDGILFAGILIVICAAVFAVIYYA